MSTACPPFPPNGPTLTGVYTSFCPAVNIYFEIKVVCKLIFVHVEICHEHYLTGLGKERQIARIFSSLMLALFSSWIFLKLTIPCANANSPVPPMIAHSPICGVSCTIVPSTWRLDSLNLIKVYIFVSNINKFSLKVDVVVKMNELNAVWN